MTILLGQHLKILREFHNYTQQYISAQLNIERTTYSNYELGKRTPPLDLLMSMIEFYHISADDLLYNPAFSPSDATFTTKHQILSQDERKLLSDYRLLTTSQKKEILNFIEFKKTISGF